MLVQSQLSQLREINCRCEVIAVVSGLAAELSDDPDVQYFISDKKRGKFIHGLQILIDCVGALLNQESGSTRHHSVYFSLDTPLFCFDILSSSDCGSPGSKKEHASSAHLQFKVCHKFTPAPEMPPAKSAR